METFLSRITPLLTLSRGVRVARYVRPYLRDLYMRRLVQGPEKFRPRSSWKPWDYESELFAFGNRIGENIDKNVLRTCFLDRSFVNYMNGRRGDSELIDISSNEELARIGEEMSSEYVSGFLRHAYPSLPEEWILCIRDRLLSTPELSFVGAHLGVADIVQYSCIPVRDIESPLLPKNTHPPSNECIATAVFAIVGALAKDPVRAHLFIRDFVLTRLLHLELCADFDFPMQNDLFKLLSGVLSFKNRGPPESRLQRQSSMNTLLACYQVGIYSDKKLVGEAPGETLEIAEMEATFDCLLNLFGIDDSRPPLPLSGEYIPIDKDRRNPSLELYLNSV